MNYLMRKPKRRMDYIRECLPDRITRNCICFTSEIKRGFSKLYFQYGYILTMSEVTQRGIEPMYYYKHMRGIFISSGNKEHMKILDYNFEGFEYQALFCR